MSNLADTLPLRQRMPLRILTDIPLLTRYSPDPSSSSSSSTSQTVASSGGSPSTGNPQCSFHVLCMHDFKSSDPVHLPFHKDEVLTIIKQEHSGWWAAMRSRGDRVGWIPSSFVLPLGRTKIMEHPDGTLGPYEGLNDPPLSAVHDPWISISEDYCVLSSRPITPTDIVLHKSFFDDRAWSHSYLSGDERSPDMTDICIPPTRESSPPRGIQRPQFPQSSVLSESVKQLTRPASPPLFATALHRCPRPCRMDDKTPPLCLTTYVNSDKIAPELTSSLDIEDWLVVLKSVPASQDGTHSDGVSLDQSESFGLPASVRLARSDHSVSDIRLLDFTIWGSDNLAEQFCVLMHTLYATIRRRDCIDWMTGRRSTEVTGLRQFFDVHDHIASWVQKSILGCDDKTQQTKALDFWIRVAEKCQALRNFDSLCAIILALSGPSLSSLGSAWTRCTQKQTFATLRSMLDVSNKFRRLMDIMDSAKGPSVPFVRGYMDHIKELHVEGSGNPPRQPGYATDSPAVSCRIRPAAISNMLCHQASPYNFKPARAIPQFIDEELRKRE